MNSILYYIKIPIQYLLGICGYVHKSRLSKHIEKSSSAAILRVSLEKDREIKQLKEDSEETLMFELSEKDAVIIDLIREKDEAIQKVNETKKAYYDSLRGMKTNARISTELARHVKRLFEHSGEIYKTFEIIKHEALRHKDKMVKNDSKIRRELGLDI